MLISLTASVLLIILLFITVNFLFIKIWSKRNKEPAMGGVIGMLVGAVLVFLLIMLRQHVYVTHGDTNYTHYVSYGPSNYTLEDGSTVQLSGSITKAYLINDSDTKLLLEEVVYGSGSWGETIEIAPRSNQAINQAYINYFFTENPPPEEVSGKYSDTVINLWLKAAD